jgi:hypothetical protein
MQIGDEEEDLDREQRIERKTSRARDGLHDNLHFPVALGGTLRGRDKTGEAVVYPRLGY